MDNIEQWLLVKRTYQDYVPATLARKIAYNPDWKPNKMYETTTTKMIKSDTLEAASTLNSPLILVFADDINPGGCVEAGAGMQEESLFRRSALFKFFTRNLYPIKENEALYACSVPLIKGGEGAFVACPGIKMPQLTTDFKLKNDDANLLRRKIELILQIAYMYGHSSIVLGAIGCGVWGCPPKHVASIIKSVLHEYDGVFETILIAIPGANYNFFNDVFNCSDIV